MSSTAPLPIPAEPRAPSLPAPARFYRPELDALRFGAFLLVFLHHALPHEASGWPGLPAGLAGWLAALAAGGAAGVDLFFTLSSYLITTLLLREAEATGRVDVRAFYLRRVLRIWPLYLAFLAFAVLVVPRLLPGEHPTPVYVLSYLALVGNFACVALGFPHSLIGPLWSIPVEEQFYLLWPLVLRRATPRRLAGVALGMIALSAAVRAGVAHAGLRYEAIWCNTFARLDPLAAGVLLAVALRAGPAALGRGARLLCAGAALLLWALVSRYAGLIPAPGPLGAVLGYLGLALAAALAVAATLSPAGQAWPGWLAYLGRISYGLYVFHALALVGAARLVGPHRPLTGALGLALTLAAASLSYALLESRFLRLKRRLARVPSGPG